MFGEFSLNSFSPNVASRSQLFGEISPHVAPTIGIFYILPEIHENYVSATDGIA